MSNTNSKHALGWLIPAVAISLAFGFFLGPLLMNAPLTVVVLVSAIIFMIPAYLMRIRVHGKVVIGGMDYGPLIALGMLVLTWAGAIASNLYENPWYLTGFALVIFISGVFCIYRGLYEGPVYGWD